MNLDNLNKWLTLFANIGVLAGIFFLAFEIQQDSSVNRLSVYRENAQGITDLRLLVTADPELSRLWTSYIREDVSALTDIEQQRVRLLIAATLSGLENAYFSIQNGLMGESEWARFSNDACSHVFRLDRLGMEFPSYAITEEFRVYLESSCN